MAITNPTKYVTTRRLGRFRQKLQSEHIDPMQEEIDAIKDGADISGIFAIAVDLATMHLKATTTAGGTFSVVDGHLLLEQQ